jgi:hypothetical protein
MIKGRGKREQPAGRYITLREYMLASDAWQSLDCIERCLYVELLRRYRGPDSNNGKIPYSIREAAAALHIGKTKASECFDALKDRGFIRTGKASGFNMKGGRAATEWLLTEFSDDTKTGTMATKDFMRWQPTSAFHGPLSGTVSPPSGTQASLTADTVAAGQR